MSQGHIHCKTIGTFRFSVAVALLRALILFVWLLLWPFFLSLDSSQFFVHFLHATQVRAEHAPVAATQKSDMASRQTMMAPPRSSAVRPAAFLQTYRRVAADVVRPSPRSVFFSSIRSKTQQQQESDDSTAASRSSTAELRAAFDDMDADGRERGGWGEIGDGFLYVLMVQHPGERSIGCWVKAPEEEVIFLQKKPFWQELFGTRFLTVAP
jgi:hypothetical protein